LRLYLPFGAPRRYGPEPRPKPLCRNRGGFAKKRDLGRALHGSDLVANPPRVPYRNLPPTRLNARRPKAGEGLHRNQVLRITRIAQHSAGLSSAIEIEHQLWICRAAGIDELVEVVPRNYVVDFQVRF